jgi:pilus assembly protein CpaB
MKKNNLVKLLGIAFVVAIVSTGVFYGLFVNKLSSNTGSGKVLVVAARNLKPGTTLQATDVKVIPWPADQLPKGTFGNVRDVVGNTVFDTIGEEEPVVASRLASAQTGGGSGVPSGMRAVSVHVADSTGVLALLRAGQKVDVQVVTSRGKGETALRTAIEGLRVLSVTPQVENNSHGENFPVVTLLASPSEADVLGLADAAAHIRLTLRNPIDDDTRSRSSLSINSVMRTSGERPKKASKSTPPAAADQP